MLLSEGQMSDYKGARLVVDALPPAKHLLADRGYDADWFREALKDKGIEPCIPPKKSRKIQLGYDKALYKQRHKVENMFGKLKDWRRIATRYDRCAHILLSNLYRCYCNLLSRLMSPDPSSLALRRRRSILRRPWGFVRRAGRTK